MRAKAVSDLRLQTAGATPWAMFHVPLLLKYTTGMSTHSAFRHLTVSRLTIAVLCLGLVAVAWWGVRRQNQGLLVRSWVQDGTPLRYMVSADPAPRPGVIVAHGFSASKQIMLGYAYTLARGGYAVMLLDFAGHGANGQPLDRIGGDVLQVGLDKAYAALVAQPDVDRTRIALLGHSMGSGAVMTAGITHPERYSAVAAISPTGADVTPALPRNLMLQAGSLEGNFVANAQSLLAQAGGPNADFAAGRARTFVEIPGVEHITILFNRASQLQAWQWFNQALGHSAPQPPADQRMVWYGLHLVGWLGLALALTPRRGSAESEQTPQTPAPAAWRPWVGLALAPIVATGALALLNSLIPLDSFLGMLVGGALAIWLVIFGVLWRLVAGQIGMGAPRLPAVYRLGLGLALFVLLWLAVGWMAQATWLQWFLIPARLLRWPLLALACLPWKMTAGRLLAGASAGRRLAWWLGQSFFLTAGLVITALFVPGMFVLILIAPALPIVLAFESLAGAAMDDVWAYGLGAALFFGWLAAALFPLT